MLCENAEFVVIVQLRLRHQVSPQLSVSEYHQFVILELENLFWKFGTDGLMLHDLMMVSRHHLSLLTLDLASGSRWMGLEVRMRVRIQR